jgi:hypothetical protein
MEILTGKEAKTAEQLLKELDISKTQLNAWLKQAVSENIFESSASRFSWLSRVPRRAFDQAGSGLWVTAG